MFCMPLINPIILNYHVQDTFLKLICNFKIRLIGLHPGVLTGLIVRMTVVPRRTRVTNDEWRSSSDGSELCIIMLQCLPPVN